MIQINPQRASRAPESMRDIIDRRNELSGNVSLNKELDMIRDDEQHARGSAPPGQSLHAHHGSHGRC